MIVDKEIESEATLFALLILMPSELIKPDIESGIDIGDDKQMKELAKKYDVAVSHLVMRIAFYNNHKY